MTVTLKVNPAQLSRLAVGQAAAAIRNGEVVAIPTDTVYALAANPFRPAAVRTLYRLKGREESKPILLLAASRLQVERLVAGFPPSFERLTARFWPGPLTIVLPASPAVPEWITAGTGAVAIRVPDSVLVRELIRAARTPLTGTSANRSHLPAAVSAQEVRQQFPAGLALIVDGGPARSRVPSTLVDLTGEPRVVREGAVPAKDVLSHSQTK